MTDERKELAAWLRVAATDWLLEDENAARLNRIADILAPPPIAGGIPVRVAVAMTTMPGIPEVMEPCVLVSLNDGTWWTVGAESMLWRQVDGPPVVPAVKGKVEAP